VPAGDGDDAARAGIAGKVKDILKKTAGVVDVDWYREDDQKKVTFVVDQEKAALSGFAVEDVARTLRVALAGMDAGLAQSSRKCSFRRGTI
jgi:multidrug efflux pump subunit AcrB